MVMYDKYWTKSTDYYKYTYSALGLQQTLLILS